MNDDTIMRFGAHNGKSLGEVPADYLMWFYNEENCPEDLKEYIEDNMKVLESESENRTDDDNDFIHAVY